MKTLWHVLILCSLPVYHALSINDFGCDDETMDLFEIIKYLLLTIFVLYNINTCLECCGVVCMWNANEEMGFMSFACTVCCLFVCVCLSFTVVGIIDQNSLQDIYELNVVFIMVAVMGVLQILSPCCSIGTAALADISYSEDDVIMGGIFVYGCCHLINYAVIAIAFFVFIFPFWDADSIICNDTMNPTFTATPSPSMQPTVMTDYPTYIPTLFPTSSPTDQKTDERKINLIVTIAYVSIQLSVAIIVSIMGAFHVRRCINEERTKNVNINSGESGNIETKTVDEVAIELKEYQLNADKTDVKSSGDEEKTNDATKKKQKGFCELWLKTVWKMRGVYGGLAVHSFDVLTDILVIYQWLQYIDIPGDNIDPKVMAYCAIAVLVFSRIISSVAIFMKEKDIGRSILQFFDLLIFTEIFETHNKIISQMKNKNLKDKNTAIESTLSFKYVRNFEAVFESIPQSVLQLVFVMRTRDINLIFIISIIQSTISMTNSVLNNDSTQMQDDKWKPYKQRLPPTFGFIKHAISRLSEVMYRIGLLALFWSVCGGLSFGIMLVLDLLFICASIRFRDDFEFSADSVLLVMNSLIVVPSEEVYATGKPWLYYLGSGDGALLVLFLNCCCCLLPAVFCSVFNTMITKCRESNFHMHNIEVYTVPTFRVGVSITEFCFLIIWACYGENGSRSEFLFSMDHGLSIFIATLVCFAIYSQYLMLFPPFSLPYGVSARSKWGYAYSNELSELVKVKSPTKAMQYTRISKAQYTISDQASFWDEPYQYINWIPLTAAILTKKTNMNNDTIKCFEVLEAKGASTHQLLIDNIDDELLPSTKDLPERSKWRYAMEGKKDYMSGTYNKSVKNRLPYTIPIRCKIFGEITNEKEFWDEPVAYFENRKEKPITAAVYALAKENYDIVNYLESKGAEAHLGLTVKDARQMLQIVEDDKK
eukprot:435298_1